MKDRMGVGIIGCGNIAEPYTQALSAHPVVHLVGVMDLVREKAQLLGEKYHVKTYPTVEELLNDNSIDLVANLTIHHAHYDVTRKCLDAGKHVFSEKPLALDYSEAQELVQIAAQRELRLGSAPFTFMGEAQQTAIKWIREGRLGKVRVVYADANWGRIETWHPAPKPFYSVGPLYDVGVYPLTLVTAIFGPARNVLAFGSIVYPERITLDGTSYRVSSPDFISAMLELANGTMLRLTTNFYVNFYSKQSGVEFHGDQGSLYLSSFHDFDALVEYADFGETYEPISLVRKPKEWPRHVEWERAIIDMAKAHASGRPHRATGEHAAHIVEILNAIMKSIETHQVVNIYSEFTPPSPMEWAL